MESAMNMCFGLSLLGLLVISIYSFSKTRSVHSLSVYIILLGGCAAVFFVYFQPDNELSPRGGQGNLYLFIIVLYAFMILGMLFHHLYHYFLKPKKTRDPFDLGLFIAPVFASPIVFIPMLSAFQNADIDLANLTLPKFMVFFVAFENGFFWREIFENRRKEKQDGK